MHYNGVPDLVVTLLLVMFALVSRRVERSTVAAIDEAQQTSQDYSGRTQFRKSALFTLVDSSCFFTSLSGRLLQQWRQQWRKQRLMVSHGVIGLGLAPFGVC